MPLKNNIEQAVLDFIRLYPGSYTGDQLANAMSSSINVAVVNLINQGQIQVKLNWTLTPKNHD